MCEIFLDRFEYDRSDSFPFERDKNGKEAREEAEGKSGRVLQDSICFQNKRKNVSMIQLLKIGCTLRLDFFISVFLKK